MNMQSTKTYSESKDAVRMRLKRQAQKTAMDDDAYKAHKAVLAKRKKEQRDAKKPKPVESAVASASASTKAVASASVSTSAKAVASASTDEPVRTERGLTADELVKRIMNTGLYEDNEKPPTETSLRRYITSLFQVQEELNGYKSKKLDFSNFKDTSNVIDSIIHTRTKTGAMLPLKRNSVIMRLGSLASILKYVKGYTKQAKVYLKLMTNYHNEEMGEREKNLEPNPDKPIECWPVIVDKNKTGTFENIREQSLFGIYTLIPVRRISDYRKMTIRVEGSVVPDMKQNYLIVNKKGLPLYMLYGDYKTSDKYGVIKATIPDDLANTMHPYIRSLPLKSQLFPTVDGEVYTEAGFSNYVSGVLSKVLGTYTTVNGLRHSYISWFLSQGNHSVEKKRAFGVAMGNSPSVQSLYNIVPEAET